MKISDWAGIAGGILGAGAGTGWLWKFYTRRQDAAHSAAETRKLNAEAMATEGTSWAAQVKQAIELLAEYRKEVEDLRGEVAVLQENCDILEDHVGSLERIMLRAGLEVPERPGRRLSALAVPAAKN
jgi:hypothetical protein